MYFYHCDWAIKSLCVPPTFLCVPLGWTELDNWTDTKLKRLFLALDGALSRCEFFPVSSGRLIYSPPSSHSLETLLFEDNNNNNNNNIRDAKQESLLESC